MSRAESEAILGHVLAFLQRDIRIRIGIGVAIIGVLLFFSGRFLVGLAPHEYTLRITGGDIVDNNHYLARVLARAAPHHGVDLVVRPEGGALAALDAVSRGDVDLAFVEGGVAKMYPNVEHVAKVSTEVVHLLVRPGIKSVADLKGRQVNLGPKDTALHDIARTILEFAGYKHDIDYAETSFVPEELLALPENKMPDAIFSISSIPSYLVELLVKDRGYSLVEIAFPEALALRYGWAGTGTIPPYTYNLTPPIPDKSIDTIAVNMYLVANSKANPAAIEKVLEALYSPEVATGAHTTFDDSKMGSPSGYPVNAAMPLYQKRNESVFTPDLMSKAQSLFGLVMTFSGMGIVLVKWFRGPPPKVVFDDAEFVEYMATVARIEVVLNHLEEDSPLDRPSLIICRDAVNHLRAKVLERYPAAKLKDPNLYPQCIDGVRACYQRVAALLDRAPAPGGAS